MSKLTNWSDSLSVDVVSLDKEHRQMVDMFIDLEAMLAEGPSVDDVSARLRAIQAMIGDHFHHEEIVMKNLSVSPETASDHIGEHRALSRAIEKFIHHVEETAHQDDMSLHRLEVAYIHSQMMRHLKDSDSRIGDTLNKGHQRQQAPAI